jgi:hypothetical protein
MIDDSARTLRHQAVKLSALDCRIRTRRKRMSMIELRREDSRIRMG